jgi:uncharacterized protein (DUF983 family)
MEGAAAAAPFPFREAILSWSGPSPSPWIAGLTGCCPRCGKGPLFQGFLTLRPSCPACGLDYGFADAGDGPAVFIMFITGAVVVGGALFVELTYEPPWWVHAALWGPLVILLSLALLRPLKGLMIALQFHHKAEEGRLDQ